MDERGCGRGYGLLLMSELKRNRYSLTKRDFVRVCKKMGKVNRKRELNRMESERIHMSAFWNTFILPNIPDDVKDEFECLN